MNILDFQRDYYELLRADDLEQFKGEDNVATQAILRAIGRQLDEVLEAFKELASKRHIRGAEGVQLDGCGDIVKLTRSQAAVLSNEVTTDFASIDKEVLASVTTPMALLERHAQNGIIPFDVIDDKRYQEYLEYKVFLNTNTCTYPEIMKAVRMFWMRSPVYYVEDVNVEGTEYHAAILLRTAKLTPSQNARLFFLVPMIKAAGVQLLREATTVVDMTGTVRVKPIIAATLARVKLPPIDLTGRI